MPTTYVADRFRGSGSVHNSAPDEKHGSVGNWTMDAVGETPPGWRVYSGIQHSVNGATLGAVGSDPDTPLIRVASAVARGPGVFVAEAKVWGPARLTVFVAGSTPSFYVNAYGGTVSTSRGGSVSSSTGYDDVNVLRIEIDENPTTPWVSRIRYYANDTLIPPNSGSELTDITGVQLSFIEWYSPGTYLCADYVHAQLNAVSGPLGAPAAPPGGDVVLPKLVVTGGEFPTGSGAGQLPALTSAGGDRVLTPAFWDRLVRAHERR